jgi:hypothetical protein
MAVAEQIGREAELRPGDKPKMNVNGIEELVTDKGYHSGAVVKRVKSFAVRSYIPEKQQKGRASGRNSRRCTRIGGACAAATARVYCGGAASWLNAASPIATIPAA